jgi:Ca2+-binding EF-hand superfamily protein
MAALFSWRRRKKKQSTNAPMKFVTIIQGVNLLIFAQFSRKQIGDFDSNYVRLPRHKSDHIHKWHLRKIAIFSP